MKFWWINALDVLEGLKYCQDLVPEGVSLSERTWWSERRRNWNQVNGRVADWVKARLRSIFSG